MTKYIKITIFFITLIFCFPWVVNAEPPTGLHKHWMDKKIDPAENFYKFADGGWQKHHPVSDDIVYSDAFTKLEEENNLKLKTIIENLIQSHHYEPGSDEERIVNFYQSALNGNSSGIKPLQPALDEISAIHNLSDLEKVIVHLHEMGVHVPFGFYSAPDLFNSNQMIGAISISAFGLPDALYYTDPSYIDNLNAYITRVTNAFALLGDSTELSREETKAVIAIETDFADPKIQLDQPTLTQKIDDLIKVAPNFNWKQYFSDLGHPEISDIRFSTLFCDKFNTVLTSRSMNEWKAYLRWQLIKNFSPIVYKIQSPTLAFKYVMHLENTYFGFPLGKLYVAEYFNTDTKIKVQKMATNIIATLKNDIQNLAWMSENTKASALNKLDHMNIQIGSPDVWPSYGDIKIDPANLLANILMLNELFYKNNLNTIGTTPNKNSWDSPPQTSNAFYEDSNNQIIIPAGILQPPFFDPNALPELRNLR